MKSIIFGVFACMISLSVEAQLMRQLKNAAERGVNRAVEKRVEAETEKLAQKQLEKAFGELYGSEGMRGFDMSKIMNGLGEDVAIADSYKFTGYQVMEITGQDETGKKNDPFTMKILFPETSELMGFETTPEGKNKNEGSFFMIYDFSNYASIILMESDGQKSRMAYGIDLMALADDVDSQDQEVLENYSITKTGKVKSILGHSCEEYLLDTDEGTAHYWISQQKLGNNQTFFGSGNPFFQARLNTASNTFNNLPQGDLLEMEFFSKTDKSHLSMTTVSIEKNKSSNFVMSDYPSVFDASNSTQ
jgi:hypothetical protein